jgi:transposase
VGLTPDGGHLTGRTAGRAGRLSVCRASVGSTLPEFREQAARLVIETGRPVAHVAAEIGVGEQLLGRWVRLARAADDPGNTSAVLDADERAELERLRRGNAELRLDREFLKNY